MAKRTCSKQWRYGSSCARSNVVKVVVVLIEVVVVVVVLVLVVVVVVVIVEQG